MGNRIVEDRIDLVKFKFTLISGDEEYVVNKFKERHPDQLDVIEQLSMMADKCEAITTVVDYDGTSEFYFISLLHDEFITGSIIAHEAYHILNMIFPRIGYDHQPNDELEAYMLGSIYEKIENFIKSNDED